MEKSRPSIQLQQRNRKESQFGQFKKVNCRYCNTPLARPFLDLGVMPLANSLLSKKNLDDQEFECPLALTWCSHCGLVQLTHVVPPDLMFANYLYVSSTTKTFQEHFLSCAKTVKAKLHAKNNLLAVDIGSNDGLLLSCYQKVGMRTVGIEPAKNLSDEANRKGFATINRFFDSSCVQEINARYGKAGVISANNVFAHIDDVKAVCRNVYELLDEEGLFVIEFPYLVTMFEEMFFDMIYHEHLSYISVTALEYLMKTQRFKIIDVEKVASHGGSLRIFMAKESSERKVSGGVSEYIKEEARKGYLTDAVYKNFAERVERVKTSLKQFVSKIRAEGKMVSGYGAPAKASTIINYCGFNRSHIDYIVDDNPLKQGLFSPGAKIPIVASAHFHESVPDYVIIFAWNFADEIIKKAMFLQKRGARFIVPLPDPKIV